MYTAPTPVLDTPIPPAGWHAPRQPDAPTRPRSKPLHVIAATAFVVAGFAAGFLGLRWLSAEAHEPHPSPFPITGPAPRPTGLSLRSTEPRTLGAKSFGVEHAEIGDDGTQLGYFFASVGIAPTVTVTHESRRADGTEGEVVHVPLTESVTTSDVTKRDPIGAAKVGWEIDLMPLPNYGYQTISGGVAHFDNGAIVTAERATSYQLVFDAPAGAGSLTQLDLTFDWLDQGRTLTWIP